jgi:hypothetical protein
MWSYSCKKEGSCGFKKCRASLIKKPYMKRTITLVSFLVMLSGAFAQKKTTVGFHGGYTLYKIHGRNADGSNFSLKTEDGFSLGMNVEIPIAPNVYLQPGIQYNQKGANFKEYHYMGQTFHGDVKLSYIEVPVNVVYKPSLGSGHLILGAGAFAGYGTGREAGVDQGMYHVRFAEDVTPQQIEQVPFYFRPWDAGANFIAGYQFANNLYTEFDAQIGMKRINPSVNGQWDGKMKHRTTGIAYTIGYRF